MSSGQKRKRSSDDEEMDYDHRREPRHKQRKRVMESPPQYRYRDESPPIQQKYKRSRHYEQEHAEFQNSVEEDSTGSESEQGSSEEENRNWREKNKMPRMKMYADAEEKKQKAYRKPSEMSSHPLHEKRAPKNIFSRLSTRGSRGGGVGNYARREYRSKNDWEVYNKDEARGTGGRFRSGKSSVKSRLGNFRN